MDRFAGLHALVIVAHSDDEVLGAGGQFARLGRLSIIHVAGQAYSTKFARQQGFASRQACGRARREELLQALAVAGMKADYRFLHYRDQEVGFHMAAATRQLGRLIHRINPDVVLTHAYEGGHQDHDSVAFAVHSAVRSISAAPPVWEMTGYHRVGGVTVRGQFVTDATTFVSIALTAADQALKRRMLACFASQSDVVAAFPVDCESFRRPPDYDFRQPPTARPLGYELEGWGMPWPLWQVLASAAQRRLMGGILSLPRNIRTSIQLRWVMWMRRVRHERPRIARLMFFVRPLRDIGVDIF